MRSFYQRIGRKNLTAIVLALFILSDINGYLTIKEFFSDDNRETILNSVNEAIKEAKKFDKNLEEVPMDFVNEMLGVMKNSVYLALAVFTLLHILMYICLAFDKKFARYYLIFLSACYGITSFISMFSNPVQVLHFLIYNFIVVSLVIWPFEEQSQESETSSNPAAST
jgi:preprotein translocase subunit SecF